MRNKLTTLALVLLLGPTVGCELFKRKSPTIDAPQPAVVTPDVAVGTQSNTNPNSEFDASANAMRVLVIDSGFDTDHTVFNGKIASKHSIFCNEEPESTEQSTTDAKAAIIASMKNADNSCHIVDGATLAYSAGFKSIEKYREKWNTAIREKNIASLRGTLSDPEKFLEILNGEDGDGSYNYHGTATAGIVAYQNPNVKLTILQMTLGKAGNPSRVTCPKQTEIDEMTKLLSDPDVMAAAVAQPMSSEETELANLINQQKISVVNMSFGQLSSLGLERMMKKAGCGNLNFHKYYEVQGLIAQKRGLAGKYPGALNPNTVFVQAAGNDGDDISSAADTRECRFEGEKGRVMVGSFDANGKVSSFSNRGKCVDVYMLGGDVVVASPDQFLNVESGTSFSAPLVVRYLSQTMKPGVSAEAAIADLKSKANPTTKFLPNGTFPVEIAYEQPEKINKYAASSEVKSEALNPHVYYDLAKFNRMLKTFRR